RTPIDTTPVSRYGFRNPAPEVVVEENWNDEAGSNSNHLIQVPMQRSIPPGMGRGARLRWIIQERMRLRQCSSEESRVSEGGGIVGSGSKVK
ncbi:unnamed protein product, partial [Acanthoscelides obtectus]